MTLLQVGHLPEAALAAAAEFHARVLPGISPSTSGEDLLLVFLPADHTHRAWRRAAVQALAREHAPNRVNAVASDDEAAIAAARDYLSHAPGVTGQYWPLDAQGAGSA
jgi:hypothetical protein